MFAEPFNAGEIGPKYCRGGPYMFTGDSERSKYCRKLASTDEGLAEIQRYNCGAGYTGMPGNNFRYTPISNDKWGNSRCSTPVSDDPEDNGIF